MKQSIMKKSLIILAIIVAVAASVYPPSETSVRAKSMLLKGMRGTCSGEQIKTASGALYILSAAHCTAIGQVDGAVQVTAENGHVLMRKILAEDPDSDLLLIEAMPGIEGLEIASESPIGEHIRTFTHGKGLPTYKTEGHTITETVVTFPVGAVNTEEEAKVCLSNPRHRIFDAQIIDISLGKVCLSEEPETVSTALVVPGSSGGMVVNDGGQLVGVVSATDGHFSFSVPLNNIRRFLRSY